VIARMHKAMRDKDEGFTLIELLVVIIIIGILAAIAIPVFLNQRKKGYEASMKSDLHTVANEEETYFTDNQKYALVTMTTAATASTPGTATVTGGNATKLSPGVTVTTATAVATGGAGTSGFCLKAISTNTGTVWYYDSKNGGLSSASCALVVYT